MLNVTCKRTCYASTDLYFAKEGEIYTLYSPIEMISTNLNLSTSGSKFSVPWYEPRNGGALLGGVIKNINTYKSVILGGIPIDKNKD